MQSSGTDLEGFAQKDRAEERGKPGRADQRADWLRYRLLRVKYAVAPLTFVLASSGAGAGAGAGLMLGNPGGLDPSGARGFGYGQQAGQAGFPLGETRDLMHTVSQCPGAS